MEWVNSKSLCRTKSFREKRILWDLLDKNYKIILKKSNKSEEIAKEIGMDVINVKKN